VPHNNLELLAETARLLEPLLEELAFVGGATTALLISDPGADAVRTSYDVDAIAAITSYAGYVEFSARLRELGFTEDTSEGAPICRWRHERIILDLMPLDTNVFGFSNRWYKAALDSAVEHILEDGLHIRVVTAVYFCATKLEAFAGRGKGDYMASHDLEDLISVIDGRAEIVTEVELAPVDVRTYITSEIRKLLSVREFVDSLPGYLRPDRASQARLGNLLSRLEQITALG